MADASQCRKKRFATTTLSPRVLRATATANAYTNAAMDAKNKRSATAIAIATTVFYGVLFWAIYMALEPFVRRHWPQTLVSWTTLLSGRVRDPIVGRDVLIGAAILGAVMSVVAFVIERRVLKSIRKGGKETKPADTDQRGLQGGLGKDGIAVQPKMKRLAVPSEKIDR